MLPRNTPSARYVHRPCFDNNFARTDGDCEVACWSLVASRITIRSSDYSVPSQSIFDPISERAASFSPESEESATLQALHYGEEVTDCSAWTIEPLNLVTALA